MTNVLDASIAQLRELRNDNHARELSRSTRVSSRNEDQERDNEALVGAIKGDLGQMLALELKASFDPVASGEFERVANRALAGRGRKVVRSLVKEVASFASHVRDKELDYEQPLARHQARRSCGASCASF